MSRDLDVTICVPVYRGREYIEETLASIAEQSHRRLTVLVSDDASDDGSAEACRPFAADPRFRLTTQPSRLGWIEHCNWLIRQAGSELVCLVSHDDILEAEHVARLVDCLASHQQSALAFTDIRVFGLLDHVEHQDGLAGSAVERVRAFAASHFDGTAFHALIRREALTRAGGLRGNAMDHFAADVSWLGRLAWAGAFERVPEPLYRKRRHAGSTSMQWGHWDNETRADAWSMHCRELLSDVLAHRLTASDREAIARAVLRRLLAIEPERPFSFIRELSAERKLAMIESVLAGLEGPFDAVVEELRTAGHL